MRAIIALLLLAAVAAAAGGQEVAYVAGGEVWTRLRSGGAPKRLTRTGGKVEDFRFSRDGGWLAYEKRVARDEDQTITSIVVVRVITGATVSELAAKEGALHVEKWIGSILLYHSAAAMEVSGFFEYDAEQRRGRELPAGGESDPRAQDRSADSSLRVYTNYSGLGPTFRHHLHFGTRDGKDTIATSRRSIANPSIAPDGRTVAYLEVVDTSRAATSWRDRVWVRRADGTETLVYDEAVLAKGSGGIEWSPDGERLAMSLSGKTFLFASGSNAAATVVPGNDVCWLDPTSVVLERNGAIWLFDVTSAAARPFISRARRPQCLRPGLR